MTQNFKICIASLFTILIFFIGFSSCKKELTKQEVNEITSNPIYFYQSMDKLTDIIVHDIFSPPVASRVYAYPCIAAYETLQQKHVNYKSLSGQLSNLQPIASSPDTTNISYELAALFAFMKTAQTLIFSEQDMIDHRTAFIYELDSLGLSQQIIISSQRHGEAIAEHILAMADKDNYKESRSFPKFSISDNDKEWKPTPPAYMEGIEPHWRTIKPFVLTHADQFPPEPPTKFDINENSRFYAELMEVKNAVTNADTDQIAIASFWDCNPYVMNQTGHMMFASKKITPGGHWMGIASIASRKANQDLMESLETATLVSIALFDAFISCWDEKYRSKLIRPETVINQYFDETWKPILQTPPFPEHTSGHSVISTAAATVLTHLLGDDFEYVDNVEVKYGLPERRFSSFYEASEEAAISRLYGGIHYMPAITEGVKQGKKIGSFINANVFTK